MKTTFNNADPKLLGDTLKKLRKEHGFSQTVIAEYLEVDRSTYTKYELGRIPDVTVIAKLAALYGISADSILSVFFENRAENSGTAIVSSADKEASIYVLNKEEQMLIEYYRNCLRKDTVLDFTQSVYLEDAESTEE